MVVLPRVGGPDLVEAREVERPRPGPGEILVRVAATAANPVDAQLRADGSRLNPVAHRGGPLRCWPRLS